MRGHHDADAPRSAGKDCRDLRADSRHAVIFTGSGATAGINRLVKLFGAEQPKTRVILGPYEHHSNILPWRESGADIVETAGSC